MKYLSIILFTLLISSAISYEQLRVKGVPRIKDTPSPVFTIHPSGAIHILGKDSKQAIIDFEGDTLKYEGDLPIDEAAKIFFEQVMKYRNEYIEQLEKRVKQLEQNGVSQDVKRL